MVGRSDRVGACVCVLIHSHRKQSSQWGVDVTSDIALLSVREHFFRRKPPIHGSCKDMSAQVTGQKMVTFSHVCKSFEKAERRTEYE